ncbi:tape measure protein [Desulfolutivibrio sulfodismutans]|uniref:tape measure protein n=1 Tax=Desulfolutivibrio sulfodismutans TaxID=63561 RepID=UPI00159DD7FE|nr:tape measure protein [Desulfolutivibrio sulfodismutans]QLA11520.1 tape measure protein [Desulfolutivibrio sulfodismutans DSM 3696]
MTTLVDTTGALGGSVDIFNRITLALGQAATKGRLMGEEVRQFAEAGIPITTSCGRNCSSPRSKCGKSAWKASTRLRPSRRSLRAWRNVSAARPRRCSNNGRD